MLTATMDSDTMRLTDGMFVSLSDAWITLLSIDATADGCSDCDDSPLPTTLDSTPTSRFITAVAFATSSTPREQSLPP